MISIVITSFREPNTIGKAIESFLNQKVNEKYELIVSAPDDETLDVARRYQKKNKQLILFQDPGKGKSHALNLLLPKLKGRIVIFSDGDVFVGKDSVSLMLNAFNDASIGCATGKVISLDSRKNIFGFWSHLLCSAAHKMREDRNAKREFLECSGYLWAFRNNIIMEFPKDAAEDTIVPILFWQKNYKISYVPKAEVFVKFPKKLNEFVEQKKRTAKGHESLYKYVNIRNIPRMKTFTNEILGGFKLFSFSESPLEFLYTLLLFPLRFYIWLLVFYHTRIKKQEYQDAWKRVESTK